MLVFFSKFILFEAYLKIEVDKECQRYLIINTHKGLDNFKRLPLNVKVAAGIFEQIIETILAGLDGVVAYIDDIFIKSATEI